MALARNWTAVNSYVVATYITPPPFFGHLIYTTTQLEMLECMAFVLRCCRTCQLKQVWQKALKKKIFWHDRPSVYQLFNFIRRHPRVRAIIWVYPLLSFHRHCKHNPLARLCARLIELGTAPQCKRPPKIISPATTGNELVICVSCPQCRKPPARPYRCLKVLPFAAAHVNIYNDHYGKTKCEWLAIVQLFVVSISNWVNAYSIVNANLMGKLSPFVY